MYKNYEAALAAHMRHELDPQTLEYLKVYFEVISEPAENIYVLDDWCYDEDENYDLVIYHDPKKITRKELFQQYSEKDLHGFTKLTHGDLIDCHGHILSANEIREIFWNMGN